MVFLVVTSTEIVEISLTCIKTCTEELKIRVLNIHVYFLSCYTTFYISIILHRVERKVSGCH